MRNYCLKILVLAITPLISMWVWSQERRILAEGRKLTEHEKVHVAKIGLASSDKIRVLAVDSVPMPGPNWILALIHRLANFPSDQAMGMSMRYGVYVTRQCDQDLYTIVHECVHTDQYERIGSIHGFLKQYLIECFVDGYMKSELEIEAVTRADHICQSA